MTFLQRLRGAQNLPDTFMRVMQWAGAEVASGIQDGFAKELAEFLEFIRMDESQLLAFLQNQMQSSSRFAGTLFQLLRDACRNSQSDLLRSEILNFLRRYSDFSSTEHLESKLLRATEDMTQSLPSPWAGQVSQLLAQLQNGVAAGDREGNLNLLRKELFPLIARYVSTTHDHGRARSILSMLTLDLARYQNGEPEGLIRSFRHLSASGILPDELGRLSDEEILRLLREADFSKASRNNAFADRMAQLTDRALQGQGGASVQEAFHNILTSILINESVYMPLKHLMVPLEWNGKHMFSELWVDPDADDGNGQSGGERDMRVLIKLDVETLGSFDLLFDTRGENVSLQAVCPKTVTPFAGSITQALSTILTRNGLRVGDVRVSERTRPVTLSEAFPKLFRGMSGVNVRA